MVTQSLPRVTEILHLFSPYTNVPHDVLENAATRGSKVHGICALIAQDLWVPPFSDELKPYVESFEFWHKSNVKQARMVEKRLKDKNESYTGQIDFVFKLNDGKVWLVDLKTCYAPQKSHAIQMGAYRKLLRDNDIEIDGAQLVYAQKTGKSAKVIILTNEKLDEYEDIFDSALKCYKYFRTTRKKNGNKESNVQAA